MIGKLMALRRAKMLIAVEHCATLESSQTSRGGGERCAHIPGDIATTIGTVLVEVVRCSQQSATVGMSITNDRKAIIYVPICLEEFDQTCPYLSAPSRFRERMNITDYDEAITSTG